MPTLGRPFLPRALESIKPQPDDEIIVVSTNHSVRSIARDFGAKYFDYPFSDSVAGGAQERSYGIRYATGDYLVFLDDDDVMVDLEVIRREVRKRARPTPHMFQVRYPGGTFGDPFSLKLGECTGSQLVCPREPGAIWPREQSGDHPFINATINLWGRVKYVDKVIISVRPEQQ